MRLGALLVMCWLAVHNLETPEHLLMRGYAVRNELARPGPVHHQATSASLLFMCTAGESMLCLPSTQIATSLAAALWLNPVSILCSCAAPWPEPHGLLHHQCTPKLAPNSGLTDHLKSKQASSSQARLGVLTGGLAGQGAAQHSGAYPALCQQ